MKPKLKIFQQFSDSILPHEATYLESIASFQDAEKSLIFSTVVYNARFPDMAKEFNLDFDKRKYYHIKSWIEKKLNAIDVDVIGEWLLELTKKLKLDLITAAEEKELLSYIGYYKDIDFNFSILYELVLDYRAYLMIRLRYEDHFSINEFLDQYESAFQKSKKIQDKLYQATIEITEHYASKSIDFTRWEKWLIKVFETESINGSNRYKAFILLAFHYNTTANLESLKAIFDKMDTFFSQGQMYCRRLLYNYYSSRVLLHTKKNELDWAIYFGQLSVRQHNEDQLMYVNNLVSIYLKKNDIKSAEALLYNFDHCYESSANSLQKITYFSYYLRVLSDLNQLQKAQNKALFFLNKYEPEIFKYRWHHFFTSYINLLLKSENYVQILNLEKRYQFKNLERIHQKNSDFLPNISWCVEVSAYIENKITYLQLQAYLESTFKPKERINRDILGVNTTIGLILKTVPELSIFFKSHTS